jgi:hypothetical protein
LKSAAREAFRGTIAEVRICDESLAPSRFLPACKEQQ